MFSYDSMNTKNTALEIAAILACYLIITLPLAGATTVNIRHNGQIRETAEYDPASVVNQEITYVRDARDITWSNVRVAIQLTSASLAHSIRKALRYLTAT